MPEYPLRSNSTTALIREAKYGNPFDERPAVLIARTSRGFLAEAGEGRSHDLLESAGFPQSSGSRRFDRSRPLAREGVDDGARAARAVAALSVENYPTTVDPGLLDPPTNLLQHLTTAALFGTIRGIESHPGPSTVDTLAYLLLDPYDGALQRMRGLLAIVAARRDQGADPAMIERTRRARDTLEAALRQAHPVHLPPRRTRAATPPTEGSARTPVVMRRESDGHHVVARTSDPTAVGHLSQAGFGACAFTPGRYLLTPDQQEWYVQERCVRAVRLLANADIPVDVQDDLLASPTSHLASWTSADVADVTELLIDRADRATLTHLLLGRDGAVQRVAEHVDSLAWHLADYGAHTRAAGVLDTARSVNDALIEAAPQPAAVAPTAARTPTTTRGMRPATPQTRGGPDAPRATCSAGRTR
jgi:hypothetical protein